MPLEENNSNTAKLASLKQVAPTLRMNDNAIGRK